MEYKAKKGRLFRHIASVPFIYGMAIPLVFLDITIEIYHRVCFPLYGIPYVKRKSHIKMDRYKLPYLPWYDKLHCFYCEYANGLLSYAATIAGATEKYWCGIKHKPAKDFAEPKHHEGFMAYGDEKAFKKKCKMQK
jgi:hypothetical protein